VSFAIFNQLEIEMVKDWTDDRKEELRALVNLLHTIEAAPRSTGAFQQVIDASKVARQLTFGNIDNGRQSFIQFLLFELNKQ
jgi:hypothetical protein